MNICFQNEESKCVLKPKLVDLFNKYLEYCSTRHECNADIPNIISNRTILSDVCEQKEPNKCEHIPLPTGKWFQYLENMLTFLG